MKTISIIITSMMALVAIVCLIISINLLFKANRLSSWRDDGKPPVVTKLPDGRIHIDRLDPGESVQMELKIPIPQGIFEDKGATQ